MSFVLRTLIRWVFIIWFALLVAGILMIGLIVALLTSLWSLLMGRKPALWTTFTRFRQASRHFQSGMRQRPSPTASTQSDDIVDVQVKEAPSTLIDHSGTTPRR